MLITLDHVIYIDISDFLGLSDMIYSQSQE